MDTKQNLMKSDLMKARMMMIKAVRLAANGCPLLAKKELRKAKSLIDKQYKNS